MGSEMCIRDSCCTDQLLLPCFSGANTLNGTPSGDGWARVLVGQIGWVSEPLHRFDADCSGSTNFKMQTHGKLEKISPHRKHTTTPTSAQRPRPPRDGAQKPTSHALPMLARFHRSRVCGNRPRTAALHTHTHTDGLIMAPCTHPGIKSFFYLKAKNGLITIVI